MADKMSGLQPKLIEGVSEALQTDPFDELIGREANQILPANLVQEDRVGELVDMVCKKSDEASDKMLSKVKHKDQLLAEQLKLTQKPQEERYVTDEDFNFSPLKEYPMTSTPRGFCLIINNTEFKHNNNIPEYAEDTAALQDVFTFLGFTVDIQENQTAQQMQNLILDYSRKEKYGDCFVCCVLSHGREQGVEGTDSELCKFKDIFSPFYGKNCPPLVGKPKVFFIQACRGENKQKKVPVKAAGTSCMTFNALEESYTITKHSDFLVSMSTVEDYVAFVNDSGSWFIESLCEHLRDGSQRGKDILTILTKVCDDVSKMERTVETKQMVRNKEGKKEVKVIVDEYKMTPETRFTLRKKLVFRIP